MARFHRDEQRTYPIWWLIAGGLFIFSTVWACYAEFVTRVPWQKEQEAFFQMEYELAKQNEKRVKNEYKTTAEPEVKKLAARQSALKNEQASGKYATAKARLVQLTRDYADAEQGKTFGKSDLDEAYYYRQLTEYDRDKAEEVPGRLGRVRRLGRVGGLFERRVDDDRPDGDERHHDRADQHFEPHQVRPGVDLVRNQLGKPLDDLGFRLDRWLRLDLGDRGCYVSHRRCSLGVNRKAGRS